MSDQKNPPRTREVQMADMRAQVPEYDRFLWTPDDVERLILTPHILEAEARGRAEALAELRAGAEPVGYISSSDLEFLKASPPRMQGAYHSAPVRNVSSADEELPLYAHPPVPREAELAAEVERLRNVLHRVAHQDWHTIPEVRAIARAALAAAPETQG